MCTGRGLVAGIARVRLPYQERLVFGPYYDRRSTDDGVCGRSMGCSLCAHAARTGGGCQLEFRDNRDLHCVTRGVAEGGRVEVVRG
jgi:hypothetical protein